MARLFGFALAAVGIMPIESVAHLGDFLVPIYELPTSDLPDLHDGTLEDWEEVVPGASVDHSLAWSGAEMSPDDLAWRAFMAWHWISQTLYVGIERVDDVYEEKGLRTGDRTQFIVDGDHSGGQWLDVYGTLGSNAQQYWVVTESYSPSGREEFTMNGPSRWPVGEPWAAYGFTQFGGAPSQSVLEFRVAAWDSVSTEGPESSRQSLLSPNAIIGIQLVLMDEDGGTDVAVQSLTDPQCKTCVGSPVFFAETFADGQLIPCHRGDCSGDEFEPSSVAPDSWGRIKASFR